MMKIIITHYAELVQGSLFPAPSAGSELTQSRLPQSNILELTPTECPRSVSQKLLPLICDTQKCAGFISKKHRADFIKKLSSNANRNNKASKV